MKKDILVALVALLFIGCSQKSENDVTAIDLDNAIDVRFEDVATDVRIIPLKSDKPIGGCYYMQCVGDEVLILENNYQTVYYFKEGKLLSTLNSVGRGPGEYTNINRICYDAERKVLYVNHYGEYDAILQYSVPEMKYIGTLKVGSTVESIKLYDDKTMMLSLKDGKEYGCFLYDIESQTITTKVCDLTTYQGENGDNVLSGFNKKSHLISLFGTNTRLLSYTGQDLEEVFKFNYGNKGVDLIYENLSLDKEDDLKAFFSYRDSHRDHFKDCNYPRQDNGVSFWYNKLSFEPEYYHYFRVTNDGTVSLKGFNVPGLSIPIVPDCITENGYAKIIEGGKDEIIDTETPLSELGQQIIDAVMHQNDDNPVIIYFNIGG